jgi:galacturan 1,4-alpha-galacturonidase
MTHAAGHSNQYRCPTVLSIYNSTSVIVTNFSIRQPRFWSFWIQDSSSNEISNIYVDGTLTRTATRQITKPTSTDLTPSERIIYRSKTGIFIAEMIVLNRKATQRMWSLAIWHHFWLNWPICRLAGLYFNVNATKISVSQDISPRTGGAAVSGGAYFKSWVGKEEGVPRHGGGGGTELVSNVTFKRLTVHNTSQAVYINKWYFKVADQAKYRDTSTLKLENLYLPDVSGTVSGKVGNRLGLLCSCSMSRD